MTRDRDWGVPGLEITKVEFGTAGDLLAGRTAEALAKVEVELARTRDELRELRIECETREKRWRKAVQMLLDTPSEHGSLQALFRAAEADPSDLTDDGRVALDAYRELRSLMETR